VPRIRPNTEHESQAQLEASCYLIRRSKNQNANAKLAARSRGNRPPPAAA
jgi:hypothetical protein